MRTPADSGYRMPAEWHPHEATWLSWPHNRDTWPDDLLREVERTYAQMIRHLITAETVNVLVADEAMEQRARAVLREVEVEVDSVVLHHIPTVDAWIRDYGPTFVVDVSPRQPLAVVDVSPRHPVAPSPRQPLAMVGWKFNGWGGKYPEYERDTGVPARINERLRIPRFDPGIVFEGGSIDVNGSGTVLTTEQCLLNPNRNPHLSKTEIEQVMRDYLGLTHIIWLKDGIVGDDTDGHVDDIARFVNETTVVCALEENPDDENYEPLRDNYELLKRATDQDGNLVNVISLPMPDPLFTDECEVFAVSPAHPLTADPKVGRSPAHRRLPASYANFYIGNAIVFVPVFDDPNDARALWILRSCFPTRRVVGLDCKALVFGYGSIHCVTQQQPRAGLP